MCAMCECECECVCVCVCVCGEQYLTIARRILDHGVCVCVCVGGGGVVYA